jgi:hypothetical protein
MKKMGKHPGESACVGAGLGGGFEKNARTACHEVQVGDEGKR